MPQGPGTYGKKVGRPPKKKSAAPAKPITNAKFLADLRKEGEAFPKPERKAPRSMSEQTSKEQRRIARGPGNPDQRDFFSRTERVRTRAGSAQYIRKPITAKESQGKIDRDLGTWQSRQDILKDKKAKADKEAKARKPPPQLRNNKSKGARRVKKNY
jgi:hypothetical protein